MKRPESAAATTGTMTSGAPVAATVSRAATGPVICGPPEALAASIDIRQSSIRGSASPTAWGARTRMRFPEDLAQHAQASLEALARGVVERREDFRKVRFGSAADAIDDGAARGGHLDDDHAPVAHRRRPADP